MQPIGPVGINGDIEQIILSIGCRTVSRTSNNNAVDQVLTNTGGIDLQIIQIQVQAVIRFSGCHQIQVTVND